MDDVLQIEFPSQLWSYLAELDRRLIGRCHRMAIQSQHEDILKATAPGSKASSAPQIEPYIDKLAPDISRRDPIRTKLISAPSVSGEAPLLL
jgi:hypothetical protein